MQSKINLEHKHRAKNFPGIRKTLTQLGAKKIVVKKQKDYFFNVPNNGRMKLRLENKTQWLIFYKRPDFTNKKGTEAKIELYKVKDKQLLSFLKKSLGVIGIVKKRREVWRLDNTVFHLDQVKGAGNIFEIELQKTSAITKKDRRIFDSYKAAVSKFLGSAIKGSNIDLVK
jgi:predicted adenylyl cyclase CyaB